MHTLSVNHPKPRVLICEDQGITILQLHRCQEREGYDVIAEVSTAQEAMEVAFNSALDLILMDVRLNGTINGIEAAHQILAHHFVPIVIVTAYTEEAVMQQALEAGVCGFITKPVTSQQLVTALETILASSPSQEKITEAQTSGKTGTAAQYAVVDGQERTAEAS